MIFTTNSLTNQYNYANNQKEFLNLVNFHTIQKLFLFILFFCLTIILTYNHFCFCVYLNFRH